MSRLRTARRGRDVDCWSDCWANLVRPADDGRRAIGYMPTMTKTRTLLALWPVFSYKLQYIVDFVVFVMAPMLYQCWADVKNGGPKLKHYWVISSNSKPTIYRNLYGNTGPAYKLQRNWIATYLSTLLDKGSICLLASRQITAFWIHTAVYSALLMLWQFKVFTDSLFKYNARQLLWQYDLYNEGILISMFRFKIKTLTYYNDEKIKISRTRYMHVI